MSDDTITTAADLGRALKLLARRRPGGPVKVASLARRPARGFLRRTRCNNYGCRGDDGKRRFVVVS
jgi:hypothetical protein